MRAASRTACSRDARRSVEITAAAFGSAAQRVTGKGDEGPFPAGPKGDDFYALWRGGNSPGPSCAVMSELRNGR
jgi:hypothetical protein